MVTFGGTLPPGSRRSPDPAFSLASGTVGGRWTGPLPGHIIENNDMGPFQPPKVAKYEASGAHRRQFSQTPKTEQQGDYGSSGQSNVLHAKPVLGTRSVSFTLQGWLSLESPATIPALMARKEFRKSDEPSHGRQARDVADSAPPLSTHGRINGSQPSDESDAPSNYHQFGRGCRKFNAAQPSKRGGRRISPNVNAPTQQDLAVVMEEALKQRFLDECSTPVDQSVASDEEMSQDSERGMQTEGAMGSERQLEDSELDNVSLCSGSGFSAPAIAIIIGEIEEPVDGQTVPRYQGGQGQISGGCRIPRRHETGEVKEEAPRTTRPYHARRKDKTIPRSEATEDDAKRYRIPVGYSLRDWDPNEEPIVLFGRVFDAKSLGKWIYDWAVCHHGELTPIVDMVGEFWRLLQELASKLGKAEDCRLSIAGVDDREILNDFIDAGGRLMDRLRCLLRCCEEPVLKKSRYHRQSSDRDRQIGIEFVLVLFGREQELEPTERLMASIRLWAFRFDVNCQSILQSVHDVAPPVYSAQQPASAKSSSDQSSQESDHRDLSWSSLMRDERSASPEAGTDGDSTDATSSDLSCLSEDLSNETLSEGHPFFQELPSLVEIALQQFATWCANTERQSRGSGSPGQRNSVTGHDFLSPQARQSKRNRIPDDEAGSGDNSRRSLRGGKKTKLVDRDERRLLLACPFYKKDKLRHRVCLRYQLTRIKDVKQHICRRHLQPQFCPLCGREFSSQSEQREHIRTQLCARRDFAEPEGITEDQKRSLSTRVGRTMTLEQQWYAVWDVVFPEVPRPSSVYVQDEIVEHLGNFHEFFGRHGQSLIADRLRSRDMPYHMPNEERDLAALLAMTAAEAVDTLIEQYTSSFTASLSSFAAAASSDNPDAATVPALMDDDSATQVDQGSVDQNARHLVQSHHVTALPIEASSTLAKEPGNHAGIVAGLDTSDDFIWAAAESTNLGDDTFLDIFNLDSLVHRTE